MQAVDIFFRRFGLLCLGFMLSTQLETVRAKRPNPYTFRPSDSPNSEVRVQGALTISPALACVGEALRIRGSVNRDVALEIWLAGPDGSVLGQNSLHSMGLIFGQTGLIDATLSITNDLINAALAAAPGVSVPFEVRGCAIDLEGGATQICSNSATVRKMPDACGVCGGDGNSCRGCDGIIDSGKVYDECGVCGGDNSKCKGCDGVINSGKENDVCGVCGGNGTSCLGCDGVPNSGLIVDACGVCGGDNMSCAGCDGVPNSGKVVDSCGTCGGTDNTCALPYSVIAPAEACQGQREVQITWFTPSNRDPQGQLCMFKEGYMLPHSCVELVGRVTGQAAFDGEAWRVLAEREGTRLQFVISKSCGMTDTLKWSRGQCDIKAESGVLVIGAPADACGECGGNGSACAGCDGVPNSGKVRDSCGTCGGTDATCDDPYVVGTSEATLCLAWDAGAFTLEVYWSGPSNHSTADVVAVYGPAPARDVWSGSCGGGGGPCTSDADCGGGGRCQRTQLVREGSSGAMVLDVTPVGLSGGSLSGGGLGDQLDIVVRYLRCRGASEHGLCAAQGYMVASEAVVRLQMERDECGVCGGDGSTCAGCDGRPNSGLQNDACGVCGGDGSSCVGCDGELGSGLEVDACGECGGDNSTCAGCDGVPYSGKVVDDCGVCGGSSDCPLLAPAAAVYCLGDAAVSAFQFRVSVARRQAFVSVRTKDWTWNRVKLQPESSACNTCNGPCHDADDQPPACFPSGCPGCPYQGEITIEKAMLPPDAQVSPRPDKELEIVLGVSFPDSAVQQTILSLQVQGPRDLCGVCGGDGQSCLACDGIPFSPAVIDKCGNCTIPGSPMHNKCLGCDGKVGGNAVEDVCGVCDGNGLSCLDCRGVPNGDAELDSCGECGGVDDSCDGSYSLSTGQVLSVCAGDNVQVFSRAPVEHAPDNRVAMFLSGLDNLPVSGLIEVAPGPKNQFEFVTNPDWYVAGTSSYVEFRYFESASGPFNQPVTVSRPILLEPPSDQCGVCGGDNSACKGCDGVPNSGITYDLCGVCGGANDCLDCAGVPNGANMVDRCGECAAPVKACASGTNADMICWQDQDCGAGGSCKVTSMPREGWNACVDCFGVVDGGAEVDSCGKCGGSDNSCAAGYTVTPDRPEFCLGQPLVARWSAPSIRRTGNMIGYSRMSADGYPGPILGWSYVDPQESLGEDVVSTRARDVEPVVIGRSYYLIPGDPREGAVMLNRTGLDQEPSNCPGCLIGSQFLRPTEQGEYQFIYFYSISSPEKAAESDTFRVSAPADVCGVCGGNGRACAGCDGVPNSGKTFDLCGVCGGNDACVGCDGRPFSNARVDICGVCKGNGRSCMGCDGIARPDGGVQEDSCGVCGGHDRSCGLPPSVGTVPSMFDYVCAKSTVDIWWRAPSNRSRADYIALCLEDETMDFSPENCIVAVENFYGNRGQAVLQVPFAMRAPGRYELRYFSRELGSEKFEVMARSAYEATTDPLKCASLEYSLQSEFEFCTSQDITLRFSVPAKASDLELKQAIIGLVEGADPLGDPCAVCEARGVPCLQCFARVCGGADACQHDGAVVLPGDSRNAVALASPNSPGDYRPCFYATYSDFRKGRPVICGEDFEIVEGDVDDCGVCGGDGLSCLGCDDNPFSGKVYDVCGVCGGNGTACLGCDGFPNSDTVEDECGVCGGDGHSCAGCDDVPNSGVKVDSCGICGGSDDHCADPYRIEVVGACSGERVRVRWFAPSNHTRMLLTVTNNVTQISCELEWALADNLTSHPPALSIAVPSGFEGCGVECAAGEASFEADMQQLANCGTGEVSSSWAAVLLSGVDGSALARHSDVTWLTACQNCSAFFGPQCQTPTVTTPHVPETTPPPTTSPPPSAFVDFGSALRVSLSLQLVVYWRAEVEQGLAAAATELGFAVAPAEVSVDAVCRPDGTLCQWFGVVKAGHPFYITEEAPTRREGLRLAQGVAAARSQRSSDERGAKVDDHKDGAGAAGSALGSAGAQAVAGEARQRAAGAAHRWLLQAEGEVEYRSAILFTVQVAKGQEEALQAVLFSTAFPTAFAAALSELAARTVDAALPTWGMPSDPGMQIPLVTVLLGVSMLLLLGLCGFFVHRLRQTRFRFNSSDDAAIDRPQQSSTRPHLPPTQRPPQSDPQPAVSDDSQPPAPAPYSSPALAPVAAPSRPQVSDETQSDGSDAGAVDSSTAPAAGIVQFALSFFNRMQSPTGSTPLPSPHKHTSPLPSPGKSGRSPAPEAAQGGAAAGAQTRARQQPAQQSAAPPPPQASGAGVAAGPPAQPQPQQQQQQQQIPAAPASIPWPKLSPAAAFTPNPAATISPAGPTPTASPLAPPPAAPIVQPAMGNFTIPIPKKKQPGGQLPALAPPAKILPPDSLAQAATSTPPPPSSGLPPPHPRLPTPATPASKIQLSLSRPPVSSSSSRPSLSPIMPPPGSARTPMTSGASLSLSQSPPAPQPIPQPSPPPATAESLQNPFAGDDADDDEWGGWDGQVGWEDEARAGAAAATAAAASPPGPALLPPPAAAVRLPVPAAPAPLPAPAAASPAGSGLVPFPPAPQSAGALSPSPASSPETRGILSPRTVPAPLAKPTAEIGTIRIGKGVLGGKAGTALQARAQHGAATAGALGGLAAPPSRAGGLSAPGARLAVPPPPAAKSPPRLPIPSSAAVPLHATPPPPQPQAPAAPPAAGDDFGAFDDDDFGDWATPDAPAATTKESLATYEKDGLVCLVQVERDATRPGWAHVTPTFFNSSATPLTHFVCKVAVPKQIMVTMGQLSGSVVHPHRRNSVTTSIALKNPAHKPGSTYNLQLRVEFKVSSQPHSLAIPYRI